MTDLESELPDEPIKSLLLLALEKALHYTLIQPSGLVRLYIPPTEKDTRESSEQ